MQFDAAKSLTQVKAADLLVIPFWKGKKSAEPAASLGALEKQVQQPIAAGDFSGKEGETTLLYIQGRKEKRLVLLGLGEESKADVERLRRAYGAIGNLCQKLKMKTLNILVPKTSLAGELAIEGVCDGLLLTNYAFEEHRKELQEPAVLLEHASLIGASKTDLDRAQYLQKLSAGVYVARNLINRNADEVTPQYLATLARTWASEFPKVKATVFDKKRIEKEGLDLLLAVNRGAHNDPAFIILQYQGNPRAKDHTVIVGKGVTYDTGGLNLKPTGSMEDMKCDMSGAAVAFGTLYAAASLGLKKNVTIVVAATENSIGSRAYKPGDVYSSYSGKTVEIGNTDAEGRLTLADALAYTEKNLKPTRMIDLATLTGAMLIALGEETTGMMSNDDTLCEKLSASGSRTYERVWRLPLFEEYKDQLKSDVADISNIGGRYAGSITAGLFLQEFVGKTPWAHLDIAGTAYLKKARRYHPKNGTGIGVRLLVDFLENL